MMGFAIGIRYLTGYSVAATRPGGEPEWPPHPARVFMALASTSFEADVPAEERDTLKWLESLDEKPSLFASDSDDCSPVTTFVPVNDKAVGKNPGLLQSAPGCMRSKQPRVFVRVQPHDDRVFLMWQSECPDERRNALQSLCRKVTRIGHSSSLVQMWVADWDEVPAPNWVPDDVGATVWLRKITPGLLKYLEDQYGEGPRREYQLLKTRIAELESEKSAVQGRSRERRAELQEQIDTLTRELPARPPREPLRPVVAVRQGYRRPESGAKVGMPGTIWDPRLIVFRLEPEKSSFPRLDLTTTLQLTHRMHEAVVKAAHGVFCGCDKWDSQRPPMHREQPDCWNRIPAAISGHEPDGSATEQTHLAYFPLAFVGSEHADGHLLALAVALPHGLNRNSRREILAAVMAVQRLTLGRLGAWSLRPEDRELRSGNNLLAETWTAAAHGATRWMTVSPIVFDRHPRTRRNCKSRPAIEQELKIMIFNGCQRIAADTATVRPLPRPREIVITPVSAHLGVPAAYEFPRMKRKDGSDRQHVHAILIFDEPVRGPIAVCAGRYRGYGFCRPLQDEWSS